MLPVIIWSPLEQYLDLISKECPKCKLEKSPDSQLVPAGWTNGQSSENQPRLLHCVNSNVILISRIYHCPNNHRVLAHHPDIIRSFTTTNLQCVVPFHLWHVTGFTIPLVDHVTDMCESGVPLNGIQKMLTSNRLRLFYKLKEEFCKLVNTRSSIENTNFSDFESDLVNFWRSSPKHHAISACYLLNFWQREHMYHHHMTQLSLTPTTNWLSCDHTFKSVRNIGSTRQADGNWVKQYKGLFCVLNAAGQVVTWKMTESLKLDDAEPILRALHNRLQRQSVHLQEFYVDNCCALRPKLQAIFGSQLKVLLDVFHAVQRISRKIPKRHPYNSECLKSLRLVFRSPSDQGSVRTQPTPPIDVLRMQLLNFQSKWEGISHNGKAVLPLAAICEIRSLLIHIDKGCLSGIPPGCGTTRNERLHRDLNSHMSGTKYGVELAYGLLTCTFFKHNEYISAAREKRYAAPITAYNMCNTGQVYRIIWLVISM